MTKTNKELAVEVAKAVIDANTVKLAVTSNNVKHQTKPLGLDSINAVIKSVYNTLQDLPEEK